LLNPAKNAGKYTGKYRLELADWAVAN